MIRQDQSFFDILEEKINREDNSRDVYGLRAVRQNKKHLHILAKGYGEKKVKKGTRRMPRLSEAKKDVTSCDKLRVSAHTI
jgi:hypothetical protein